MPQTISGEGYREFSEPRFFECATLADVAKIRNPVDKAHAVLATALGTDIWKFDASSAASADGFDIIASNNSLITGRWLRTIPVINVRTFGATGDGTTNDAPAIRSAMSALTTLGGGSLYFPRGTYLLSTRDSGGHQFIPLTSNLHIYGDGMGATTLKVANNLAHNWGVFSQYDDTPDELTDITIRDLTIDCNGTNNLMSDGDSLYYDSGIELSACDRVFIQRVHIHDCAGRNASHFSRPSIAGRTCHNVTITDCLFTNFGSAAGIAPDYNQYQTDHSAIYIDGNNPFVHNNRFINSSLPYRTAASIEIHSSAAIITNNYTESCTWAHISATTTVDSSDQIWQGNIAVDCHGGFYLLSSAALTTTGLRILDNSYHVTDYSSTHSGSTVNPIIDLSSQINSTAMLADVEVAGNLIDGTDQNVANSTRADGIYLSFFTKAIIHHNTFQSTVGYALEFGLYTALVPVVFFTSNRVLNCARGAGVAPVVAFDNAVDDEFKRVYILNNIFRDEGDSIPTQAFGFGSGTNCQRAVIAGNEVDGYANNNGIGATIFSDGLFVDYPSGAPKAISGTYTVLPADTFLLATTGSSFTATLPLASTVRGKRITFQKVSADSNTLTIDGNGAETIDGSASTTLTKQWDKVELISDGTQWLTFEKSQHRNLDTVGATTLNTDYASGGTVTIGGGPSFSRYLSGGTTWDPGNVVSGAFTSTTVTVAASVIGDPCFVGFTPAVPAGVMLTAAITTPGTATVTLFNISGGDVDLGSGTVRVTTLQP